ncbi:hypothetical protein TNCV_4472151 [Trichonephila clavipes]|uniref:Uncharacterized protein n=1 Tax=Trichonephila clavipes TaxID=2585209 RepID=A0A8X6VL01_TRICX|nr:hypothetical protein TNCV_4472151 [Trichonephila clavipes]
MRFEQCNVEQMFRVWAKMTGKPKDFKNAMKKTGLQILNNDQIVTSVQEESDPVEDEMGEDEDNNNESSKGPLMLTRFLR